MMQAAEHNWAAEWAPALMDEALRAKIVGQSKFAARIERDLLEDVSDCDIPLEILAAEASEINALVALFTDDFLVHAGLYFCAPLLPETLRPLEDLADVSVTRDRLQMVLFGRNHTASGFARTPRKYADLVEAGQSCLSVWIRQQPHLISERLAIRVPAARIAVGPHAAADAVRYAAVETALNIAKSESSP